MKFIKNDEQKKQKLVLLINKELSKLENNKYQIETSIEYAHYQLNKFKEDDTQDQNRELIPIQERKIKDFESIREVYQNEINLLEDIKKDLEEE